MAIIVLADDDADLRAIYAPCLNAAGHVVFEAENGDEAIDLIRSHWPDLLLLDLWMPRRSGFEVLDISRHDPIASRLKVMILSNLSDADVRLEAFGGGASEFLVKGIALADLIHRVDEILADSLLLADPL